MEERFGSLNNNYSKIERVLGKDFLSKSEEDILTVDDFLEANYKIGDFCYGKDFNQLLWDRNLNMIYNIYGEYIDSLGIDELKSIDFSKIGLILIRPECFYYRDKFKKFLEDRNLKVLLEKQISLDFKQYLSLYYESITLEDTMYDFPSRTLNYIDNDCYLMVVTSKEKENVPEYLTGIKGKQGKYAIGTLRGDVAYNLLKQNIHEGQLIKEAIIPLDPIGAGRMLTRDKIKHDGSHNVSDIPILFYAAQSVHVPNEHEIRRDIATLCSKEEIEYVLKKVRAK